MSFPHIDHVIITTQALSKKFQPLADWRTQMGRVSRVVTLEEITAKPGTPITVPDTNNQKFWLDTGYLDGGTRDDAEAVRNFLKWAHHNWGTEYVLIGGNGATIPIRRAITQRWGQYFYQEDRSVEFTICQLNATSVKNGDPNAFKSISWECGPDDKKPELYVTVTSESGLEQYVNRIELTWGSTYATSYTIQASIDGKSYSDVISQSGKGGTETLTFNAVPARYFTLRILSGTDFSLNSIKIFGMPRGRAYKFSNTVTRLILPSDFEGDDVMPNSGNDTDPNLIVLITSGGPQEGKVIPYNEKFDDSLPGWHFIKDFSVPPGDQANILPPKTLLIEITGPASYHGYSFLMKYSGNYIPTDLYYTDIDISKYPFLPTGNSAHDWDADNNSVYGENYHGDPSHLVGEPDTLNLTPVLYLGRVSVSTEGDVDIFVNKVIRYEKFVYKKGSSELPLPDEFALSFFLGEYSLESGPVEDLRKTMLQLQSNWDFMCRYEDAASYPDYGTNKRPDLGLAKTSSDIIQGLERDVGGIPHIGNTAVALMSHGTQVAFCLINRADVGGLSNCPGVWFAFACLTSQLDCKVETICEAAMGNPDGGSVGYIGNSRLGQPTVDKHQLKDIFTEMCNSGILGKMFQAQQIKDDYTAQLNLGLSGDPAMRVWSNIPIRVTVHPPATLCTGSQLFMAEVTDGKQGVGSALVCISMDQTILGKGDTDTQGHVSFPINPSVKGDATLTVSGKNILPYTSPIGTINVMDCPPGSIRVTSTPTDAEIWIDGVDSQKTTESTFGNITPGTHIVMVSKFHYQDSPVQTVTVSSATETIVHFDLSLSGPCKFEILGPGPCTKNLICSRQLICRQSVHACASFLGACPVLMTPDKSGWTQHITEIWGTDDLLKIAQQIQTPEGKEKLDKLPPDLRKPLQKMLEQISREEHLGE
ncbi:MAG: C25 family cysteine peptidase [Methanoregula sp.]|jgi:hypothetical protein|uniref:C25 family cysteine peptidase n=1 Tax=Methanoregula sp. TaxID=2052170 RepID=UPI003C230F96